MPFRAVRHLAFGLLLFGAGSARAQEGLPFTVDLEEVGAAASPALHSATVGAWGGRWLFLGGRTGGIHLFGSAGFPASGVNPDAVVYDPAADTRWTASLATLPDSLADPLRAWNTEFYQDGPTLYVVGGYGPQAAGGKVTFPTLLAVDVPAFTAAVVAGAPLAPHVRRLTDVRLAVTGGHLLRLGGRYHLAGGHRFDGEYISGHSPFQAYTDAVRHFRIDDDGASLRLADYAETVDAERLHRRDGNAAPVVRPDGSEWLVLYGGVFTGLNLPFRHPVLVDEAGATESEGFTQRIGHYTAPALPLYDAATGSTHTLFLGGMGQDYVDAATGDWRDDTLIPFVDDVAVTSRDATGAWSETVLPFRMPGFLGTNMAVFPADGVPRTDGGVVRLRELAGRTLVASVHGGIAATTRHPGLLPTTGTSSASARVFAVYVTPLPVATEGAPEPGPALALGAPTPSPVRGAARLTLTTTGAGDMRVEAFDALGRRVAVLLDGPVSPGAHALTLSDGLAPGLYVVRATASGATATQRIAVVR